MAIYCGGEKTLSLFSWLPHFIPRRLDDATSTRLAIPVSLFYSSISFLRRISMFLKCGRILNVSVLDRCWGYFFKKNENREEKKYHRFTVTEYTIKYNIASSHIGYGKGKHNQALWTRLESIIYFLLPCLFLSFELTTFCSKLFVTRNFNFVTDEFMWFGFFLYVFECKGKTI